MCSLLNGVIKHDYFLLLCNIFYCILCSNHIKNILYNLLYYGVYKTSLNAPTGIMFLW